MTTDITELAQSLKAAAENAIGAHERLAAYPYGEIIDISQHEGEQIDIDITDLNEFNKEANPVNILALVDALEKAQQRIDELESRLNSADKLQDSAFRSGLQHGFSLGQTDDQKGYEQSMAAYSSHAGIKVEAE